MIIFEIHYITNAESGGASVTGRKYGRIRAKIGKGRRKGLTIWEAADLTKREFPKDY